MILFNGQALLKNAGLLLIIVGLMGSQNVFATLEEDLLRASSWGNIVRIEECLNVQGIDINSRDNQGRSALLILLQTNFPRARCLVFDTQAQAAQLEQFQRDRARVINELIQRRANVNLSDIHGKTALMRAVLDGRPDFVRSLLDAGAEVNHSDSRGDTALVYAMSGNLSIVDALLDAGADVNVSNQLGETPLRVATRLGRMELIDKLIEHGADVNRSGQGGDTALMFAAQSADWARYLPIVEHLIDAGADVNRTNNHNETALMMAERLPQSVNRDAIIWALNNPDRVRAKYAARKVLNAHDKGVEVIKQAFRIYPELCGINRVFPSDNMDENIRYYGSLPFAKNFLAHCEEVYLGITNLSPQYLRGAYERKLRREAEQAAIRPATNQSESDNELGAASSSAQ